jgi:hypothetical protein
MIHWHALNHSTLLKKKNHSHQIGYSFAHNVISMMS